MKGTNVLLQKRTSVRGQGKVRNLKVPIYIGAFALGKARNQKVPDIILNEFENQIWNFDFEV